MKLLNDQERYVLLVTVGILIVILVAFLYYQGMVSLPLVDATRSRDLTGLVVGGLDRNIVSLLQQSGARLPGMNQLEAEGTYTGLPTLKFPAHYPVWTALGTGNPIPPPATPRCSTLPRKVRKKSGRKFMVADSNRSIHWKQQEITLLAPPYPLDPIRHETNCRVMVLRSGFEADENDPRIRHLNFQNNRTSKRLLLPFTHDKASSLTLRRYSDTVVVTWDNRKSRTIDRGEWLHGVTLWSRTESSLSRDLVGMFYLESVRPFSLYARFEELGGERFTARTPQIRLMSESGGETVVSAPGYQPELSAYRSKLLSRDGLLLRVRNGFSNRFAFAKDLLEKSDRSTIVFVQALDAMQHIFFHHLDRQHPHHSSEDARPELILGLYKRIDQLVQELIRHESRSGLDFLLSPYGFSPLRRVFQVNEWLEREGFLTMRPVPEGTLAPYFLTRDSRWSLNWKATDAFQLGFHGISFQPGISAGRREILRNRLKSLVDPGIGSNILETVATPRSIYGRGGSEEDLLLVYSQYYGTALESSRGEIPGLGIIRNSSSRWTGDHLMSGSRLTGLWATVDSTARVPQHLTEVNQFFK